MTKTLKITILHRSKLKYTPTIKTNQLKTGIITKETFRKTFVIRNTFGIFGI